MAKPIGQALLYAGGAVCIALAAYGLIQHTVTLARYLHSSPSAVQTSRPEFQRIVERQYQGLDTNWRVNYIGLNGQAFKLSSQYRRATLTELGRSTIADRDVYSKGTVPLEQAYGALLADVRGDESGFDRATLKRIAASVDQAYRSYQLFSLALGLNSSPFPVGTRPSFDAANAWERAALIIATPQTCLAKVASTDGDTAQLADVAIYPRLLEVTFDRPWMSEDLLDAAASGKFGLRASRRFAPGMPLSVIPASIWVSIPSMIEIKSQVSASASIIKGWSQKNTCCKVECPGSPIGISASSTGVSPTGAVRAFRNDEEPTLFAVISRRRTAGR